MFENYTSPDECRIAAVCGTLEHYWARRELSEIEARFFHASFGTVLDALKDDGLDPVPFFWDRSREEFTEVRIVLERLLAEGALVETRIGAYRFYVDKDHMENDGIRKIRAYCSKITGSENKKLHRASNLGYTRYKELIH